jgi:hypothetical protein
MRLRPDAPDSYTSTGAGVYSRRARLAAVDGSPMPTKHTGLPDAANAPSCRAALTIMISSVLAVMW